MWQVIGWWYHDTIARTSHPTTFVVNRDQIKLNRMDLLAEASLKKDGFLRHSLIINELRTWSSLLVLLHGIVWPLREAPLKTEGKSILGPLHRPGGRGVHPAPEFQLKSRFPPKNSPKNLRTALSPTVVVVSVGCLVNWRDSTSTAVPSINVNHIFSLHLSNLFYSRLRPFLFRVQKNHMRDHWISVGSRRAGGRLSEGGREGAMCKERQTGYSSQAAAAAA